MVVVFTVDGTDGAKVGAPTTLAGADGLDAGAGNEEDHDCAVGSVDGSSEA